MSYDKNVFSRNLNKFMLRDNRTRDDIIKLMEQHGEKGGQSAISDWIKGNKLPRMDKLSVLAEYFSVNLSDLLESKEDQSAVDRYAELLFKKPMLLELVRTANKLSSEDLETLINISKRFENTI